MRPSPLGAPARGSAFRRLLRSDRAVLAAILLTSAAMAAVAARREVIPYNADQAVVGLMAQDILYQGRHRVFFDGSEYSGTLEQYYLAAWFAVLPDTVNVHRAAMASLLLGVIAAVWASIRRLAGRRAAAAGALFLALGPHYLYLRGVTSDGSYTPFYLLAAATLCLLARAEWEAHAGRSPRLALTATGLLLGLAWWTHPMALALVLVALASFASKTVRRSLRWHTALLGLLAFLAGSLPWWLRNLETGWASARGPETTLAGLGTLAARGRGLFMEGIPLLAGGSVINAPAPAAVGWVLAAIGAYGALLLTGSVLLWRRGEGRVRRAGLLVAGFCALAAAMGLLTNRVGFSSPRFLFPSYFLLALCFGVVVTASRLPLSLRLAMVAAVGALHLHSHLVARPSATLSAELVRELQKAGVTALYTTYWQAYPITFRSGRQIVAAPFTRTQARRGRPEELMVDQAPAPAFLLQAPSARQFAAYLESRGLPYRRSELAGMSLFQEVPAAAVASARACACIPGEPR